MLANPLLRKNHSSLLKSFSLLLLSWLICSSPVSGVILEIKELQPDPRDGFACPIAFDSTYEAKILGLCKDQFTYGKTAWPCLWSSKGLTCFPPHSEYLLTPEVRFSQDKSKIFGIGRRNSVVALLSWDLNALYSNKTEKRYPEMLFNTDDSRELNSFWISDDGEEYIFCFNTLQNHSKEKFKYPYKSNCVIDFELSKTETIVRATVSTDGVLYLLIQDTQNDKLRLAKNNTSSLEKVEPLTFSLLRYDLQTDYKQKSKKIHLNTLSPHHNLVTKNRSVWIQHTAKDDENFDLLFLLWNLNMKAKPALLDFPQEIKGHCIEWVELSDFGYTQAFAFSKELKENNNKEHLFYLLEDFQWTKIQDKLFLPKAMTTQLTKVFGNNQRLCFSIYQHLKTQERVAYLINLQTNDNNSDDDSSDELEEEDDDDSDGDGDGDDNDGELEDKVSVDDKIKRLVESDAMKSALNKTIENFDFSPLGSNISKHLEREFEEEEKLKEEKNKTKKENSIIEFGPWIYKLSKNDERFNPEYFTVLPIDVFNAKDTFESGTWIVSTKAKKEPCRTKFYTIKMIESSEESSGTPNVSDSWCTHQ